MKEPAILVLQDGTIFHGYNSGTDGYVIGEIVFNTSMTGYQEILTDPSYADQLIAFTYPHIGNVGVNIDDEESKNIYAKGVILKNISNISSNYRSTKNLLQYIKEKKIIVISNIDTRKLTRILRNRGSQYGCIQSNKYINIQHALKKIKSYKSKKQIELTKYVGTKKYINGLILVIIYIIKNKNNYFNDTKKYKEKITCSCIRFRCKKNILNILNKKGCQITLVPYYTPINILIKLKPSGVLLSNGPGDPRLCTDTIKCVKKILKLHIPIFGICLGHQILALAAGAEIKKMKFGHHGSNHPVQNINTKHVFITSQNHNFTINPNTINKNIIVTHVSLFDQTIQGIKLYKKIHLVFRDTQKPVRALMILKNYLINLLKICVIRKNYAKKNRYKKNINLRIRTYYYWASM
ncbi:carbamoyl-phosphate synthase small chain [Buchnera aphidicola (Cinara tujafilina)]|uniref:Carbamoyl phosphate synthase small chain n=1 Tax=Buchnera aphidicola (Cinara tujafilina) TaxID=261317 RepID=F7WZ36_9GAMM|nr:carbamoyl-phosphate synthase small chain [Buchnera aphidicola (Cinara tujafilina)]